MRPFLRARLYLRVYRQLSRSSALRKDPIDPRKPMEAPKKLENVEKESNFYEDYLKQAADLSKGFLVSASSFGSKSLEKIGETTAELGKTIDQTLKSTKELAESTYESTSKTLEEIANTASSAAQSTLEKSKEFVEGTVKSVERFGESAAEAAQSALEKTKELADSTSEMASKTVDRVTETVTTTVQTTFEKTKEVAESTADLTVKSMERLGEATTSAFESTVDFTKKTVDQIGETASSAAKSTLEKTKEITDSATESLGKIYDETTTMAQSTLEKSKELADSTMRSLEKFGENAVTVTQTTLDKSQELVESTSKSLGKTLENVGAQIGPIVNTVEKTTKAIVQSKLVEESLKQAGNLAKGLPKLKLEWPEEVPKTEQTKIEMNLVKKPENRLALNYRNLREQSKERASAYLDRLREKARERLEMKFPRLGHLSTLMKYTPKTLNPIPSVRKSIRGQITGKLRGFGNITRGISGYYWADGWKHDIRQNEEAQSALQHFVDMTIETVGDHLKTITQFAMLSALISTGYEMRRAFKFDRKEQTHRHKIEAGAHVVGSFGGSYAGSSLGAFVGDLVMPGLGTVALGLIGAFHGSATCITVANYLIERFIKK